jgi:hypothetical protein
MPKVGANRENKVFLNPREGESVLGLYKGAFLSNTQGLLESTGKEVKYIRIKNLIDIDKAALQTLLQEAMVLNEMDKKRKS